MKIIIEKDGQNIVHGFEESPSCEKVVENLMEMMLNLGYTKGQIQSACLLMAGRDLDREYPNDFDLGDYFRNMYNGLYGLTKYSIPSSRTSPILNFSPGE
jgi:hypothetical protein